MLAKTAAPRLSRRNRPCNREPGVNTLGRVSASRGQPIFLAAVELISVGVVYFVLAKASLAFASVNPSATPIWPPTGLALALVLIRGDSIIPAIFFSAFVVNYSVADSVSTSIAIAIGNSLEAYVGARLIKLWASGTDAFDTPPDIAKFVGIVAAFSTPISATTGVIALSVAGLAQGGNATVIWTTWWLGDVAGALLVTPAIVLWSRDIGDWQSKLQINYETILLLFVAAAIGIAVFGPLLPLENGRSALGFVAVLPLLWAALRSGPRETAAVALTLSAFAIWGTSVGRGPFVQGTLNDSFLMLIAFIASATLPSLALSAALHSRERALRKSTEDYRALVESVRDYAIFMLDPLGRVISWNSGAEKIKQYSADQILGSHFSCFYTAEDQKNGEPERLLAIAKEKGKAEFEGWRVRRDGTQFRANIIISTIYSARGEFIGFSKVTRDVSERYAAQKELEAAREELFQAQKLEALGQLTGGIAHDFNNLLTVISIGQRMIDRPENQSRRSEIVREMEHAVNRGIGLVRQLLAFARRETLQAETIDVAQRIEGMLGLVKQTVRETIVVKCEFPPDLWPIKVDPTQFELAILNLAVNARDAMPEGGVLTIYGENVISDGRDSIHIGISDTGTGMLPEVRARAFEPFYTTKGPAHGTGLGLSQVYGFVTQSEGTVRLSSEPGQGTRVVLVLPRSSDKPVAKPDVNGDSQILGGTGEVLVVEDNDQVANMVCTLIEQLGYRSSRVSNARDALDLVERNERFDVLFSDILLPGSMNGIDLAEEVRARKPQLAILLTTGFAGATAREDLPFPVLKKPYQPHELGNALRLARQKWPKLQ